MAPFLAEHDVFLLGNHGVVTLGRTLEEVYFQMERLELFARIRLAALALGPARALPPEEAAKLAALRERLRTVPGIAYFAPAYGASKDVEAIKVAVVEKLAGFVVSDCPEPCAPLRAGRSRRAQDRLTSKAEMGQSRDPPAT